MKKVNIIAGVILLLMLALLLGSIRNESATMDELAHIPAGYSYVTQRDFRLNPEHPPLIKALSGWFTRLAINPYFPTNTSSWTEDVNGQWTQGAIFLYESGNDADAILFWSRLPIILLAIIFGGVFFVWLKRRYGSAVALLGLTLFTFSPTVLAHSRYVTTDLGAAFGFFLGIITFLRFLERPSMRSVLLAGAALGVALLLKFSTVLLLPMYLIMLLAWIWVQPNLHVHERIRMAGRLIGRSVIVGLIAVAMVWLVYAYFTANYPIDRQYRDAEFILSSFSSRPLADFNLALMKNSVTRSLGEYLFGFLMVSQRAGGGNTGYFLGEVSASGSRVYFPLLYLLKESLAFHILTALALVVAFRRAKLSFTGKKLSLVKSWIANHFAEFSALVVIAVYWASSIASPLNIGIRHVLPTFPFIYFLVSQKIVAWLRNVPYPDPGTWSEWFRNVYQIYLRAVPKYFTVGFLLIWSALGSIAVYPHFLPYYNELAGGVRNGYTIAVDSNYDWGQDLIRLKQFVEENKIEKIAVDYFGGGSPRYYLGDKFEPWQSSKGPAHGWFAVSATFREGAFGMPVPGFNRRPEDSYGWLRPYEPVSRAGYSIFIYNLP